MALSYAQITTRVLQFLQDTGATTFTATITGYAIENELKRLSRFAPAIIDIIFKIESREGSDTAGTASKLTDTTKSQFLAADATNEKVVHNITDDTWAVVTAQDSTSVLSISADIMDDGEDYEIYNKRCKNKRQIYIGDMPPYLWIESVEYPVGTERNFFMISRDIIELDVEDATIQDSDSTLDDLEKVDVLIKFALPQVLCQLTDLAGEVDLVAGYAAGVTTIHVDGLAATEVIEVGEMFTLENHRTTYIITASTTLAANEGDISFYPSLEAAVVDNDDITFVKSTLQPNHEDLLERMVTSRAAQSDLKGYVNATKVGGGAAFGNYLAWINTDPLLNSELIRRDLEALARPRRAKRLSRE